jgi:hypothetical protein
MLAQEYIEKAITSCQRALEELQQGQKRKAVGSMDFCKDRAIAAISILISEIQDEEGQF